MNIITKDSFRSKGRGVNQSNDMYRVTVDMSCKEYALFTQYKSRQENKDENSNSALECLIKAWSTAINYLARKISSLPVGEHNNKRFQLLSEIISLVDKLTEGNEIKHGSTTHQIYECVAQLKTIL